MGSKIIIENANDESLSEMKKCHLDSVNNGGAVLSQYESFVYLDEVLKKIEIPMAISINNRDNNSQHDLETIYYKYSIKDQKFNIIEKPKTSDYCVAVHLVMNAVEGDTRNNFLMCVKKDYNNDICIF